MTPWGVRDRLVERSACNKVEVAARSTRAGLPGDSVWGQDGQSINRTADLDALRHLRACLLPGGTLTLSLDRAMPETLARLGDPAHTFPDPWPEARDRGPLADGDELEQLVRTGAFDPATRVERMDMRTRLWRDGEVILEEEGSLRWSMYETDEMVAMLLEAVFGEIEVEGRYTRRPPAPDDEIIVPRARAVE